MTRRSSIRLARLRQTKVRLVHASLLPKSITALSSVCSCDLCIIVKAEQSFRGSCVLVVALPSSLAPHDDHADCTGEMGTHPLYLSSHDQRCTYQTSHCIPIKSHTYVAGWRRCRRPFGIHYLDDFPANAVYQLPLLSEVLGQHHLGSLGQEQYRFQTTGGVHRCAPCPRAVMRGRTIDYRVPRTLTVLPL